MPTPKAISQPLRNTLLALLISPITAIPIYHFANSHPFITPTDYYLIYLITTFTLTALGLPIHLALSIRGKTKLYHYALLGALTPLALITITTFFHLSFTETHENLNTPKLIELITLIVQSTIIASTFHLMISHTPPSNQPRKKHLKKYSSANFFIVTFIAISPLLPILFIYLKINEKAISAPPSNQVVIDAFLITTIIFYFISLIFGYVIHRFIQYHTQAKTYHYLLAGAIAPNTLMVAIALPLFFNDHRYISPNQNILYPDIISTIITYSIIGSIVATIFKLSADRLIK